MAPKVSVIIPTYNCAKYITRAIDSALNQTFNDIEIIIVDDGSTDNTYDFVKPYERDGAVKYIYQENKGVAEARNIGILAASGYFIAYVDSDDELDRKTISICIERIEEENSEWCVTDILRVRAYGDKIIQEICRTEIPAMDIEKNILSEDFILRAPFFKRDTLLKAGLYDKTMLTREDWDMNIRLIRGKVRFSYIPLPLYIYNVRNSSVMRRDKKMVHDCTLKVLRRHHKEIANSGNKEVAKIYAENLWWLGRAYLTDAHSITSFIYCVTESMRYDLRIKKLLRPILSRLKVS